MLSHFSPVFFLRGTNILLIINNLFLTFLLVSDIFKCGDGRHPSVESAPEPGKQAKDYLWAAGGIVAGSLDGQRSGQICSVGLKTD